MLLWLKHHGEDQRRCFSDVNDLVDYLRDETFTAPLIRQDATDSVCGYRFDAPWLAQDQFLVLYWGDQQGVAEAALNDQEVAEINGALAQGVADPPPPEDTDPPEA